MPPPAEQVQIMKEDDVVEQLNHEKKELQAKLDKLEKVLHSLNTDRRQSDGLKFVTTVHL